MKRDNCGELKKEHEGKTVHLAGWVSARRDHGGLIFVDLRDSSGIVQLSFNADENPEVFKIAEKIRLEYVVEVIGEVALRGEKNRNPNMPTGDVEIIAKKLEILNTTDPLPFNITGDEEATEEVRFQYRYLDLRRQKMQNALRFRYKVSRVMREFLDSEGFIEVETPILTKSTPEGARDYLVPSRKIPGNFFALPQSPQQFKQMLQTAGIEKYFQFARCFRDEDQRGDRQPEFTQLDIEASFVEEQDIMQLTENLLQTTMQKTMNIDLKLPLPRLTFNEAMKRFGTDSPDTRFGLELFDISEIASQTDFKIFKNALENNGSVRGICAPNAAKQFSRKKITELETELKAQFPRVQGLLWAKLENDKLTGGVAKFFDAKLTEQLVTKAKAQNGDIMFFIADKNEVVFEGLGNLRVWLARKLELIPAKQFNFLWITDFPMFEFSEEENRFVAKHHPFTQPKITSYDELREPANIKARAYDLVLNGVEIAGGSIRIHKPEMQYEIFKALGFTKEQTDERFGHLIKALRFGTPPHGGIAWGFDRFVMLLLGLNTIRDVIAFPKTLQSKCLLTDAPSAIEAKQLAELSLKFIPHTNDSETEKTA